MISKHPLNPELLAHRREWLSEDRDFVHHPRSVREALSMIRCAYRTNMLTTHKYTAKVKGIQKYCAVGVLFTDAQLTDLRQRDRLNVRIDNLVDTYLGKKNLKAVTGLNRSQALAIQQVVDLSTSLKTGHQFTKQERTEMFADIHNALETNAKTLYIDGIRFNLV